MQKKERRAELRNNDARIGPATNRPGTEALGKLLQQSKRRKGMSRRRATNLSVVACRGNSGSDEIFPAGWLPEKRAARFYIG